jgi:energy-coupling factor transporter transmembrane protein EcfT
MGSWCTSFCLHEVHKLTTFFLFIIFLFIYLFFIYLFIYFFLFFLFFLFFPLQKRPLTNWLLSPVPPLGCHCLPYLLKCAQYHHITARSSQKQLYHSMPHCSCSFTGKWAVVGVKAFCFDWILRNSWVSYL